VRARAVLFGGYSLLTMIAQSTGCRLSARTGARCPGIARLNRPDHRFDACLKDRVLCASVTCRIRVFLRAILFRAAPPADATIRGPIIVEDDIPVFAPAFRVVWSLPRPRHGGVYRGLLRLARRATPPDRQCVDKMLRTAECAVLQTECGGRTPNNPEGFAASCSSATTPCTTDLRPWIS